MPRATSSGARPSPRAVAAAARMLARLKGPTRGESISISPMGLVSRAFDAVGPELIGQRPHLAVGMAAVGEARDPHPAVQLVAPGIVQVEDRQARGRGAIAQNLQKQAGFGGKVILQVPVVIQVVLAQVGEDPHIEGGPVHPMQIQGVGGDLHADVADALRRAWPAGAFAGPGIPGWSPGPARFFAPAR